MMKRTMLTSSTTEQDRSPFPDLRVTGCDVNGGQLFVETLPRLARGAEVDEVTTS